MARYREVADDLRSRIGTGEFGVGQRLPSIAALQEHYGVPSLNTIRQSQQLLVSDGLLETRQGQGAFVLRSRPRPHRTDVLGELRSAYKALGRAIAALEAGDTTSHSDLP